MKSIKFYTSKDPYFEFSNFYEHPIRINGVTFSSNEHYFQAMKCKENEDYIKVINSKNPGEAKSLGQNVAIREDWEDYKNHAMAKAVNAKFKDYKLRKILMDTGDAVLQGDEPDDYYWGIGKEGTGKNKLGIILMELRSRIRKELL